MKIGILTLPLHTNYGGILQAYALQTVLERMGHEVVVMDKQRFFMKPVYWKYPFRVIKKIFFDTDIVITREKKILRESPVIEQNIRRFIDKYIHLYNVESLSELKEKDFDAIVVGSDQVWRPKYFMPMFSTGVEDAYLKFAKNWNVKRIAYAASFGTDDWEYTSEQTEACGELLKMFDVVSVREESAVGLCKEHFGVDAQHVLDPTMLLDKEDYIKLFEEAKTPKSPGNMLCYILDVSDAKKGLIERISRERGLIPFRVNAEESNQLPLEHRIKPSIEQWLRGFYDAEFVVTDSFHACVFSILFNKPFVAIGNEGRGMARFQSLLKIYGLEDRLVTADSYQIMSSSIAELPNVQEMVSNYRSVANRMMSKYLHINHY